MIAPILNILRRLNKLARRVLLGFKPDKTLARLLNSINRHVRAKLYCKFWNFVRYSTRCIFCDGLRVRNNHLSRYYFLKIA